MSGIFWLDAAGLAVSLHNTILLLWLGLTVLFNAEKRTWGIWLAGLSLLLASLFFVSHTVILTLGLSPVEPHLDFWWRLGWVPVLVLPFGWYLVVLWYSGFWETVQAASLANRQWGWFRLTALLNVLLIAALAFAHPLPSFAEVLNLDLSATPEIGGIPILLVAYAVDIFLCVVLSLDALLHTAPTPRMMGQLARARARPWLIGAALLLLMIGVLVSAVIAWALANARNAALSASILAWLDLVIALLIALSIICVGQAVALYEVFTGKTLPRRGLFRQWRSAVILAGSYGIVVGGALTARLEPIYIVLLTTALMTVFYALFSWRSYVERERYIRDLRPFVTSQHLYEQLVQTAPSEVDAATPFRALCRNVLGARVAHLAAVGPLAPLVPGLAFPEGVMFPPPSDLGPVDSQTMRVALDPTRNGGAGWAIPLWSERGLIGILRLGEKTDGGLYTQEEIEIARASGERLIDTLASAELARRLMTLQRQRVTETQLGDWRARRILHDDILPKLHAAIIELHSGEASRTATHNVPSGNAMELLTVAHREVSNLLRDMPTAVAPEVKRLGLIGALKQAVEDEWRRAFDRVEWQIEATAEQATRALPALTAETLFFAACEAIRNAARHGRDGERALHLRVAIQTRAGLEIIVEDDGVGPQNARLGELGSGQGLAMHSVMLAVIGATLSVEAVASRGTRVTIVSPGA